MNKKQNIKRKPKRSRAKNITNETIMEALRINDGLVYLAAKTLGCVPKTIYNHFDANPDLEQFCLDCRQELTDVAEKKLRMAVQKGRPWAVAMVLKTQGRKRGYVERQEIDHSGSVAQPSTFADWLKIETERKK